jgi:hypothetical protein
MKKSLRVLSRQHVEQLAHQVLVTATRATKERTEEKEREQRREERDNEQAHLRRMQNLGNRVNVRGVFTSSTTWTWIPSSKMHSGIL